MDKSSKKLLSEFKPKGYRHGGYHSLLDEFMEVMYYGAKKLYQTAGPFLKISD